MRPVLVPVVALLTACLAIPLPASAQGEVYPQKNVRLVVPFPPGGSADFLGRLLADRLGALWGRQVIVENRPGGSTLIGLGAVARSEPDGYTLGMNTAGLMVQPAIRKTMPFDVLEDFSFITRVSEAPFLLTVPAGLSVRTMAELAGYAKANPGKLNFGSFGIGSTPHILGETLALSIGAPMVHVPFKGTGDLLAAHLSGQVQINFDVLQPMLPHIRQGTLRPLLITASTRSPELPDVPTAADAGFPDLNMPTWFGLLAPRKVPADVVHRIQQSVVKVLQMPEVTAALEKQGMTIVGDSSEQFRAYSAAAIQQVKKVVRAAGIAQTD